MLKNIIKHEQKALTSNQQASIQIPVYGRIQNLVLYFTDAAGASATEAQVRAEIGNIRFTVNGIDVVNTTATRLLELYESLGQYVNDAAGVAGCLELNLGRLFMEMPEVRDNFGFGALGVQNIQVTVTAGTLSNIAAVQAFTARDNTVAALGAYCKMIDYPQSFTATGDHTCDTLPRDNNSAYLAVMTTPGASGVVSFGEVRVNNFTISERVPRNVNGVLNSSNRFAQIANVGFFYNFNDGSQGSILPMDGVTDFRLITTYSTAPGAAGYVHTAITINNLRGQK